MIQNQSRVAEKIQISTKKRNAFLYFYDLQCIFVCYKVFNCSNGDFILFSKSHLNTYTYFSLVLNKITFGCKWAKQFLSFSF
jgi:hypothetical protein